MTSLSQVFELSNLHTSLPRICPPTLNHRDIQCLAQRVTKLDTYVVYTWGRVRKEELGVPKKNSKKQIQNKLLLHFLHDIHNFRKRLFPLLVVSWVGWIVLICLDFPFDVSSPCSSCHCQLCSSLLEIRMERMGEVGRGADQISRWYLWYGCLFRKCRMLWICILFCIIVSVITGLLLVH